METDTKKIASGGKWGYLVRSLEAKRKFRFTTKLEEVNETTGENTMKRSAAIICAFLLCAAFTWAQTKEITIGVDLSTTGAAASLGIPDQNAILLTNQHEIAGQKVRFIYLDDASDPATAVQNVKRLISQDNIDVLLGPSITPVTIAVTETIAEAKVPMICFASGTRLIYPMDAQKKWVFKTAGNDNTYITAMVNEMARKGVKTLGIIAVNDPYGEGQTNALTQVTATKGISITGVEKFNRDDPSATAEALRTMSSHPDAIAISASGTAANTPTKALYQLGYKGLIFHAGGMVNADFLRVGGSAVEGIYTPTSPMEVAEQLPNGYPTKKTGVAFFKLYESKYGQGSISEYAGHAWDAIKLLNIAIPIAVKKGQPGTVEFREALRDALENDIHNVVGAQAVYNMTPEDHSGIDQRGMVMVKVVNGAWVLESYPKY
jgi:branched-chain amino acid transport system substrate-binding protein